MVNTISVGELRQNPTAMLRAVRSGASYTVTDHGEPVAEISKHRGPRWVAGDEVDRLLRELGVNEGWSSELAEARSSEEAVDPWGTE